MLKHKKNVTVPDGGDANLVRPSDWNDDHQVTGGFDLPLETVSAPAANTVRLFGGKLGGRMMPAFEAPDGVVAFTQSSFALKRGAFWYPQVNVATPTLLGFTVATSGTATAAGVGLTNAQTKSRRIDYLATTPSTSAIASLATANNHLFRDIGFFVTIRAGGATGMTTATHRFFMGMTSQITLSDIDPSSRTDVLGAGYDSADTNFQIMHKTGSGAFTKIDLGASFPRQSADRSKMYDLTLYSPPVGTSVFYQFTDLDTGAVASGEITTSLPASTTAIRPVITASVGGTSSVIGIAASSIYTETDF